MMPVSGFMIGRSCRAASSVSHSLTQNITRSTGPMGLRVVGHVHAGKVDGLRPAFDREAALAHGREVAAARHEMNVRTALGQPGSKIAADASRTHDGNAQGSLL